MFGDNMIVNALRKKDDAYRLATLPVMGIWVIAASSCNILSDSDVDVGDKDDVCAAYCEAIEANCEQDRLQYSSVEQCRAVCDTFEIGKKGDESGNTAYCRAHFAEEAEESPGHCASAGPGGDDVCGGNCESFCHIQTVVCTGANRRYATVTECLDACEALDMSDSYSSNVLEGDTFSCRLAHLVLATTSPDEHCPHIAPASAACQ
jgi:hypothetical protein